MFYLVVTCSFSLVLLDIEFNVVLVRLCNGYPRCTQKPLGDGYHTCEMKMKLKDLLLLSWERNVIFITFFF